MAVVVVTVRWEKRCCVCGKDVGALGAVVAFVVNRSSVGCCGDFWEAMQQSWSVLWHRGEGLR